MWGYGTERGGWDGGMEGLKMQGVMVIVYTAEV